MSDQQPEQPKEPDLERVLKDNPLLRSTAEAIARDHNLPFEEALKELLKVW